jgi:hypothetical protein
MMDMGEEWEWEWGRTIRKESVDNGSRRPIAHISRGGESVIEDRGCVGGEEKKSNMECRR